MVRKYDFSYDSSKSADKQMYQLASGYISETAILFARENIVAVIQAKGSVEFFDAEDKLIAAASAPPVVNGKEAYTDIGCYAANDVLELHFPVYEWIDNYPNCDGEHDRWDTRILGFHTMKLDLNSGSII